MLFSRSEHPVHAGLLELRHHDSDADAVGGALGSHGGLLQDYKGSGDHNKEETNFENLKVTRRLEETVEYHNNAEENNFLENAFYIMAFFALVIGWLAFQLGIRFGREEVPEQLGDQRGNGLQAPLLQQDDQRGLVCEDSPEVQHGAG